MKRPLAAVLFLSVLAFAQEKKPDTAPEFVPVASAPTMLLERGPRFQVVAVSLAGREGVTTVIKVDTQTGKTWTLTLATEADKKMLTAGMYWYEVPNINRAEGDKPVAVTVPLGAK